MRFSLTSSRFTNGGAIPAEFTCEGSNRPPPLRWDGEPAGTKSFALIVEDPDAPDPRAPKRVWVHWVLYNLPAHVHELAAGMRSADLPGGAREGLTDFRRTGYGGPCPPMGRHRYFHRIYALDVMLPDLGHPRRDDLEAAMAGHVLAEAELMGTYERQSAEQAASPP